MGKGKIRKGKGQWQQHDTREKANWNEDKGQWGEMEKGQMNWGTHGKGKGGNAYRTRDKGHGARACKKGQSKEE